MPKPNIALMTAASALTAVALWGLAFPLIQDGLVFFSPVMLGFVRFALASIVLAVVLFLRFPFSKIREAVVREWKPLLALALLYVTIPNIAQNMGLEHGTSSIASVIQSSGPVMTLVFAVILLREKLTRLKTIGTVVAMSGTVLLVASGGISLKDEDFVSNILILVSATSYGLAWVSAKKMLERNPPLLVISLSLIFGTALLALALPFEPDSKAVFNGDSVANLLVLGVFCAGVSSVAYLSSLEHEEVSQMAFFIYLMPVFASVFAWALRGEGVEPWTAFCGLIIVAGIVIANKRARKPAQAS
jgi:drug/metabolite transporter (DMT)-like permease